ncbi:MAG: tetratricopeptide repeat protein [Deltaproteobacteria bacterium]|nr:tetratricopeptide repeat protein [Deltaproteobacteria bacterium]
MKQLQRMVAVVFVALALLPAAVARADKKSDAEAKKAYMDGTKYYNLGDFPKAIEHYKRAYELKPDAVFLYNIAQSYRLSNDFTQALFFYKSFLRNLPDAPNRAEVERRITEMEDAQAKAKATANAPPNDPLGPKGNTGTSTGTDTDTDTGTDTDTDVDTDTDSKIPDPSAAGEASDAGQENGSVPAGGPTDTGGGKKPIYKKWWFWAGIGAVAVGTVAIIAVSSGGGASAPSGDFDTVEVF